MKLLECAALRSETEPNRQQRTSLSSSSFDFRLTSPTHTPSFEIPRFEDGSALPGKDLLKTCSQSQAGEQTQGDPCPQAAPDSGRCLQLCSSCLAAHPCPGPAASFCPMPIRADLFAPQCPRCPLSTHILVEQCRNHSAAAGQPCMPSAGGISRNCPESLFFPFCGRVTGLEIWKRL